MLKRIPSIYEIYHRNLHESKYWNRDSRDLTCFTQWNWYLTIEIVWIYRVFSFLVLKKSLNLISPPKHSNLWRSFCTFIFRWTREEMMDWVRQLGLWNTFPFLNGKSFKIPWFQSPPIRLEVWLKITETWFRLGGVWFFHGKGSSHNFSLAPSPNYEWTQRWGHWTVGLRCLQASYYYRRYNWVVLS